MRRGFKRRSCQGLGKLRVGLGEAEEILPGLVIPRQAGCFTGLPRQVFQMLGLPLADQVCAKQSLQKLTMTEINREFNS
jgi:hypothetical protein